MIMNIAYLTVTASLIIFVSSCTPNHVLFHGSNETKITLWHDIHYRRTFFDLVKLNWLGQKHHYVVINYRFDQIHI